MVLATAMLFSVLVFTNTMTASAYLQVRDLGVPAPRGGYTFVVPETIYLKPAVSAPVPAEFFLNNDINGMAVQNETEASMRVGKIYIGHENAVAYKLYYRGNRTTPVMTYTCAFKGELWTPTVGAAGWLTENTYLGENTSQAREWYVEMHIDTNGDGIGDEWHDLLNVGAVYQPRHMNSLITGHAGRGTDASSRPGGLDFDFLWTVNGLHNNWTGASFATANYASAANGRVHPPFTPWTRWFPLLNDLQGDTVGSQDFMNSGDAAHPLLGRRFNFAQNGEQNSQNGYNVKAPKGLGDTTNNMSIRLDTSRNTTWRGIPNFKFGYMTAWAGATDRRPRSTTSRTQFRALNINGTTVTGIYTAGGSNADFVNVSGNGGSITNVSGRGSSFFTTEADLNNLSTNRARDQEYQIFTLRVEWDGQRNADWIIGDVAWRVNTPNSNKAEMRRRYQNTIWQGPTRAGASHTSAMTSIGYQLGDPLRGEWQASMDGWPMVIRTPIVPATGTYNVTQQYVFNEGAGPATLITCDGTNANWVLASTGGKKYETINSSYYASLVSYTGVKAGNYVSISTPATLPVPGYTYTHSTINGAPYTDAMFIESSDNKLIQHYFSPNNYQVKYDANGGTGSMGNSTHFYNTVKALDANAYAKTGYVFDGWSLISNGPLASSNGVPMNNNASVINLTSTRNAVVTLYARWKPAEPLVTFQYGGGGPAVPATKLVTYNADYGALPAPTLTGHTLTGWFTTQTDTPTVGTKVTATTLVKTAAAHNLWARWEPSQYQITFDANGGSTPSMVRKNVTFGLAYGALPATARTGYNLSGWLSEFGGALIDPAGAALVAVPNDRDHKLIAQWTAQTATVSFNSNGGGAPPADITVTYDQAYASLPPGPAAPIDNTFIGWFTAPTGGVQVNNATLVEITGNHTLYAQWLPLFPGISYIVGPGADLLNPNYKDFVPGDDYGKLPIPTRTGYVFEGWYLADDFSGTPIKFDDPITNPLAHKIYAKWTAKQINVMFDANGGTAVPDMTVTFNTSYGTLPTSVRTGYTLQWWTAKTGGTQVLAATNVTNDKSHTLYARWAPKTSIVTLQPNGPGVTIPAPVSKTVTFDLPYGTLSTPTRPGFDFAGWYTLDEGGSLVKDTTKVSAESDHDLYAQWIPAIYEVRFNDTTGGGAPSPAKKNVAYLGDYDTLATVARAGYDFAGWWTTDSGPGVRIWPDTQVTFTAVTHPTGQDLHARWTPKQMTVTLNYNYDGAPADDTIAATHTFSYTALPASAVRTGYDFKGWWTTPAGVAGREVKPTDTVTLYTDHTLYARWAGKSYEVTFNSPAGGTPTPPAKHVVFGSTYGALASISRTGYNFDGWYTANGGGTKVEAGTPVTFDGDHDLWASWSLKDITVRLDPNGGDFVVPGDGDPIVVPFGNDYGPLPEPERDGYVFVGWFDGKAADADEIFFNTPVTNGNNHSLFAHWDPLSYDVIFNPNYTGATWSVPPANIAMGSRYGTLPVPTRDGHTFAGWWTEALGGEQIRARDRMETPGGLTLYAHWTLSTDVRVTLQFNNGTTRDRVITVTYDEEYPELPVPTRTGYDFVGWFDAEVDGDEVIGEDTIVDNRLAHTLYAYWTPMDVKVLFDANGGAFAAGQGLPIFVTYGDEYGNDLLTEPTRDGYVFRAWYTDPTLGAKVTEDTIMNKEAEHTLYARWTPDSFNVLFDDNGGVDLSVPGKEVTMGLTYGALATVSRPGYDFAGWYTALSGGTRVYPSTTVTNGLPHTLYARWAPHEITVTYDFNFAGSPAAITDDTVVGGNYLSPLPTAPNRLPIFAFAGWFTAPTGGSPVLPNGVITATQSHTVYAQWLANSFILVTWRANGGMFDMTAPMPDAPYVLPATEPTRPNYDFAGWFTSETGGTKVTAATTVTNYAAHTLYAQWTPKVYNVTFNDPDNNVTTLPAATTVRYGEAYGALPTVSADEYTFLGWFTAATGGTEVEAATVYNPATGGDHILYARWDALKVEVTFTKNAADATAPDPVSKTYSYGRTYGTLATVTRPGYDFAGWWTTPAAGGERVYPGSLATKQVDDKLELFARWTPKEFVLTLDHNYTGKPAPQKMLVTFAAAYGALPTPERAGYDFAGWWTTPETGGTQVTAATTMNTDADHTLYARWTAHDITVTFVVPTGATVTPASIKVLAGEPYNKITGLPTPTRTGYNFAGWYTRATGGFIVTDATIVTNAENHSLYARWTAKNDIEVSFLDSDFSNTELPITVTFDARYGALPVLTEPGYTFMGWFTAATGGTRVDASTIVSNAADHTLHARWKAGIYNVLFDKNAADATAPTPAGTNVTLGNTYGLDLNDARDSMSYAGYDFAGWWTIPAATGGLRVYPGSEVTNSDDPHTLYARWAPKTLTVTFDFNFPGKPAAVTDTVTFGGKYDAALPTCVRPGYALEGWYTLASGGTKVTGGPAGTTVTETDNHTLYAQWTAVPFRVDFIADDADTLAPEFKMVTAGLAYGTLAVAEREGYKNASWFTRERGGTEVTAATIVADDLDTPLQNTLLPHNLYARWTPNTYTVTFVDNDHGNAPAGITVTFDANYGTLPNLTEPGFMFLGWYLEDDGNDLGDEITAETQVKIADNHVLYAHWVGVTQTVTYDFNYPGVLPGASDTEVRVIPGGQKYGYIEGALPDELPEQDLPGYTPEGWWTQRTGGTEKFFDSPLDPTVNTLYARWKANPYDVEFYPNYDGLPSMATKTFTFGSKYGSALENISRTGYDFEGWWTTPAIGGTLITASDTVAIPDDHALYARWTPKSYTLTFNGNGGAPDPTNKQVSYGSQYGALATAERAGYDLVGWGTSPTGGTPVTADDDMLTLRAHTLFAQWEAKKYTVTFHSNGGGAPSEANKEVTFDGVYGELPTVARLGYEFAGWFVVSAPAGGDKPVSATSKVTNPTDHTLYAKWNLATYGVMFNGNGGPAPYQTGKYVNFAQPYGELPEPKDGDYPGFTFIGWYTTPAGGTRVTEDTIVETGELHTLYAHWSPNDYLVTFVSENGSAPSPAHKIVKFGNAYGALATSTRTGYDLAGWWTTPLTGGTQVTPATTMSKSDSHEIYARWDAKTFTVTLDPNGGTVGRDFIVVTYDRTYSALPVPSRADYNFDGWYTAGGVKVDPADTVDLTGPITLTARWTAIVKPTDYLLTVQGGTGSGRYPAGTPVTITAQAPSGSVFVSWSLVSGSAVIASATSASTTVTTAANDSVIKANFGDINEKHCKCHRLHNHNVVGRQHPHRLDHINNFWGRLGCFFCRFWHGTLRWVFFGWIWM